LTIPRWCPQQESNPHQKLKRFLLYH